jgi:BirA family biotin operon repressor/biotin-[acetyl-CoA-carboxylase] ligase
MNPKIQKERARFLRKNMTDSERRLWSYLSRDQLGVRFLRQLSIGPYIVDFVCLSRKIIVECDGGQHHSQQRAYDQKRDLFLRELHFTVLRFWNTEILANIEGVIMVIQQAIKKDGAHHPPSPLR